jgi:hypothetical protein
MKNTYKQCKLSQNGSITTAWIPERGAKVNASVEVPDLGGFWNVLEVYSAEMDAATLREHQRLNRNSLTSIL